MARKRFTKEIVLDEAFQFLRKKGLAKLSVRALAKQMNSSVYPLYMAFEDKEALEAALFERSLLYFEKKVFHAKKKVENPIVALGLNFLLFAKRERNLYQALCIDSFGAKYQFLKSLRLIFRRFLVMTSEYQMLREEEVNRLFSGLWIFLLGVATLMRSETIVPSENELAEVLEQVVPSFVQGKMDIDFRRLLNI